MEQTEIQRHYKCKRVAAKRVLPSTTHRPKFIQWESMAHIVVKCMVKHFLHLQKERSPIVINKSQRY